MNGQGVSGADPSGGGGVLGVRIPSYSFGVGLLSIGGPDPEAS